MGPTNRRSERATRAAFGVQFTLLLVVMITEIVLGVGYWSESFRYLGLLRYSILDLRQLEGAQLRLESTAWLEVAIVQPLIVIAASLVLCGTNRQASLKQFGLLVLLPGSLLVVVNLVRAIWLAPVYWLLAVGTGRGFSSWLSRLDHESS